MLDITGVLKIGRSFSFLGFCITTFLVLTGCHPGNNETAPFSSNLSSAHIMSAASTSTASFSTSSVINIVNSANNFCLSDYTDSGADGAPQGFEACNGAGRQNYQLSADPSGPFALKVASHPSLCVDIPYASSVSGTLLQQYSCNGTAAQDFRFVAAGSGYNLISVSNSLCLDGNRSDGRLQQLRCSGSASQIFYLNATGNPTPPPVVPSTDPLLSPYVFDVNWYLQNYADLRAAFGTDTNAATDHWRLYGVNEGRQASPNFSSKQYLAMYPDIADAYGSTGYRNATLHYVNYGRGEGRAGVSTTGPVPTPTPVPPLSGSPTGLGFNKGVAVGLYYLNPSELAAAVADMKSMGTTWVRMEFPWNLIQPNDANSYNLDAWDRSVQACSDAGIRVLGLIDYTPQWARPPGTNQFFPPSNLNDFAIYSAFLARRYGPMGVHTWEIWNEENGETFYKPGPNPAQYVALLKGAFNAIKSIDSGALVMLGGMATFGDDGINQNARTFLANVYAAGGGPYFDAVAFHPYVYPQMPSSSIYNNWGQMAAAPSSLRGIMIANGDGAKKIWMTEFGYPTFPNGAPGLTESGQAAYLQEAYQLQATYSWAGPLFWYTYHDATSPNPGNPEDYFGLLRPDGSQKPAYQIYKSLPK